MLLDGEADESERVPSKTMLAFSQERKPSILAAAGCCKAEEKGTQGAYQSICYRSYAVINHHTLGGNYEIRLDHFSRNHFLVHLRQFLQWRNR